jgi:hypothetical protein
MTTANRSLCSLQKEQQVAMRSLALYKKSNKEQLTSLLFKKRAIELIALFTKEQKSESLFNSFCTDNPLFLYLYSLFVLY